MNNFSFYTPTKVIFGKGTVDKVGEMVKEFGGSRVLLHYGGQSAIKSGLIDRVKKALDQEGIFHVELGGVVPNPHLEKVYEGIELAKENRDVSYISNRQTFTNPLFFNPHNLICWNSVSFTFRILV